MITHLGKPIYFENTSTPEQIKFSVQKEVIKIKTCQFNFKVQNLIREHQRLPGSILRGIMQRFFPKEKCNKETSLLLADLNPVVPTLSGRFNPEYTLSPHHKNELGHLNCRNLRTEKVKGEEPEESSDL